MGDVWRGVGTGLSEWLWAALGWGAPGDWWAAMEGCSRGGGGGGEEGEGPEGKEMGACGREVGVVVSKQSAVGVQLGYVRGLTCSRWGA